MFFRESIVLVLVAIGVFFVTSAAAVFVVQSQQIRSARREFAETVLGSSRVFESRLSLVEAQAGRLLRTIGRHSRYLASRTVQELASDPAAHRDLMSNLQDAEAYSPYIHALFVASESNPNLVIGSLGFRESAVQSPEFGELVGKRLSSVWFFVQPPGRDTPLLAYAEPVLNLSNFARVGYLVLALDPWELLGGGSSSAPTPTAVITGYGQVIAGSPRLAEAARSIRYGQEGAGASSPSGTAAVVLRGNVLYGWHRLEQPDWYFVVERTLPPWWVPTGIHVLTLALTGVVAVGCAIGFGLQASRRVFASLTQLVDEVERCGARFVDTGERFSAEGPTETAIVATGMNSFLDRISELIGQLHAEQEARHDHELRALQQQLNPHFVANTLTTIKCLAAMKQNEEVVEMADTLNCLLRSSLEQRSPFWLLRDEIEYCDRYLSIQRIRFRHKIHVAFQVDPAATAVAVPRFSVQPLVENVINHGVAPDGRVEIAVRVTDKPSAVVIEVADSGPGLSPAELAKLNEAAGDRCDSCGVGLSNLRSRLRLYYGPRASLSFDRNSGGGLSSVVELPKRCGVDS